MIRVGVAGWDYPDWAGIVYPSPPPRRFDRLSYLAGLLDAVEINVTFYRPIEPKTSRSWVTRVPSGSSFMFTAKLYQAFTHARSVDLDPEARTYLAGVDPLLRSGRLGAVLMQFPHAFHDRPESRTHLSRVVELLPGLPLVAEFRHRSWDNEGALAFLKDLGVGFCNVDQPALGSTLPPTGHATSRIAYVRLHGRNAANWFVREGTRRETPAARGTGSARYDYFYSMKELQPWVERIRRLAGSAEEVFVIANNHYRGKAPANALMLKKALSGRRVLAPAGLIAAYPELAEAADPLKPTARDAPKQGRLF
jgi:uncharacterized protein YecE (DUF72 family)